MRDRTIVSLIFLTVHGAQSQQQSTQYLNHFACRQIHHLYHGFTIAYLHQRVKSDIKVLLMKQWNLRLSIAILKLVVSFSFEGETETETTRDFKGYNKEIVVDWLKQTSVQFGAGRIWNFPYGLAFRHAPQSSSAVQRAGQDCVIIDWPHEICKSQSCY